jgi:cytochrome c peroxidase
VNASFYKWTNWAGRFAAQWELPLAVAENAKNMNGDRLTVVHLIFNKYKTDYEAVFGTLDAGIADTARFPAAGKPGVAAYDGMAAADKDIATRVYVNFGKALQAYMRKLVSRNARFDRLLARDVSALTAQEVRGAKLFIGGAGCIGCHSGPQLSDGLFHNIGVAQTGPHVPATENGRFTDGAAEFGAALNVDSVWSDDRQTGRLAGLSATLPDGTKGQFRTASLRGIAETAPYMHAGQLASLDDVVAFYDRGGDTPAAGTSEITGKPLGLTTDAKADLVAFLKTLTGEAVAAGLLTDTSAP